MTTRVLWRPHTTDQYNHQCSSWIEAAGKGTRLVFVCAVCWSWADSNGIYRRG